jgi:hypothetical protein
MGWHDTLMLLGLKLQDLFGGFAGGVVSVFLMRKVTPWEALGSIMAGALTANYFGDVFSSMTGLKTPVACFITGLTAMAICQGIVEVVKYKVRSYAADATGGEGGKKSP